jgi:hypothetical protein
MTNPAGFIRTLFAIGLVGLLSFSLSVSSATAATTNPKVLTLNDQVHHNLLMLPWYGVFDNLEYQINGTEVILTGEVTSEHGVTKDDAGRAVKSIPGVTNVVNNIEVLPHRRSITRFGVPNIAPYFLTRTWGATPWVRYRKFISS